MANETMFVAAAIWLTGMLGFFTFLMWYMRSWLLKKAALVGCFGVMLVSMEILRRGWQNFVVSNELAGIAEVIYHVMVIGMIAAVVGLTLSVIIDTIGFLKASAEGRRYDWEKQKHEGI